MGRRPASHIPRGKKRKLALLDFFPPRHAPPRGRPDGGADGALDRGARDDGALDRGARAAAPWTAAPGVASFGTATDFALDRLRLEGVDPDRWAPTDEFWSSIEAPV